MLSGVERAGMLPRRRPVARLPHVCAHRVDIVNHTAQLGGAETALLRLLEAIDRDRFDVRVLTFEDGELVASLASRGIHTQILPLGELNTVTRAEAAAASGSVRNTAGAVAFAPKLARVIRDTKPAIVVATSLKAATLVSIAAPLARRPWVWHLHDRLAPDYLPGASGSALRTLARRAPRQLVVNSRATLESVGRIDARRVSVAYPGLEAAAFVPQTNRPAQSVVGILGRLSETKGQLEFVRAAVEVAASRTDVTFRIIGSALFRDSAYEQKVRDVASASDLGERLEFAGWTSDPGAALRQLSLLVHASPVPEPFGQVIVEAMAAGVPVIATAAGGVLEILDPTGRAETIENGVFRSEFGVLVRPGDAHALALAIAWVLQHPVAATDMATRARESALQRFSIEETSRVISSAWERALPRTSKIT
jgi:glycosyltransferase involved in cell wall biosynthesis